MNARRLFPKHIVRFPRQAQSGQAIVLIALVMLGLVAALGLAIDGGGLYLLWRNAQNATDAAALAASYARCTRGDIVQAALEAADKNGFNNDGATNTVTVHNPPVTGAKAGDPNFVEVDIWAVKPSYFIQIVYKDPLSVTNSAVGMCYPPFDPSAVGGAWAGSAICQNTFKWGGSYSRIEGGIFSNFQIQIQGSDGDVIGPVEAVGLIASNNTTYSSPPVSPVAGRPDPLNLDIGLYAPGGAIFEHIKATYGKAFDVATFDPGGQYISGQQEWDPGNRVLEGLYYVNGDVKFKNNVTFGPDGVTIVATGSIEASNNAYMRFYEHVMDEISPRDLRFPGILLFSAAQSPNCGASTLKFSGGADTWGVFYAPKGGMNVSGNSITMRGSLIADTISYDAADGYLIYDRSLLPPRPSAIQITQ